MGFKVEQEAQAEPVYCDYIQEKIDIAKKNGAIYELVDEDYRIQALYDQENLVTKDKIKVINRVRSTENGKESIVVNKNVDFYTADPQDPKNPGVYKDRYSTREGIVELPLKTRNAETGAVEVKQTQIVYTIPFSGSKVDEYMEKAEKEGSIPQLVFYDGATTSSRLPTILPAVTNVDYFKEATWNELLLGREKKVLNSMVNRLPEVRKEYKDKQQPTEVTQREEIKPSDAAVTNKSPKEEVNKEQDTKETIVEPKQTSQHPASRFGDRGGNSSSSSGSGGTKKN